MQEINPIDHAALEKWALELGVCALLGFICTLLIVGKVIHHIFQRSNKFLGILVMPPAVLSGTLGLISMLVINRFDSVLADDLNNGLETVVANLQNYIFSALILGLHSISETSQANLSLRGIMLSIMHEGMPMMVYSQILIWGQSAICLLAICASNRFFGMNIKWQYGTLVPTGVETGTDVLMTSSDDSDTAIISESESLGMIAITISGILLLSLRPCLETGKDRIPAYLTVEHEDAFGRVRENKHSSGLRKDTSMDSTSGSYSTPVGKSSDASKDNTAGVIEAGLGVHLSLISLTTFVSFGVALAGHLLEIHFSGHFGSVLTGVRMFKLGMFASLAAMLFITKKTKIRFKRHWFMLLCGLFLDLVFISALSKSLPRPQDIRNGTHYLIVGVMVFLILLWNLLCYFLVARNMFPNFRFERSLVLSGAAMGNSYVGLLFARVMDPLLQSPVPAAFGAKLLLFFIPSSAAKNKIIQRFLEIHGLYPTVLVCVCVVCAWFGIFKSHFNYNSNASGRVGAGAMRPNDPNDDGSTQPLMSNLDGLGDSQESGNQNSPQNNNSPWISPSGGPGAVEMLVSEPSNILNNAQFHQVARWIDPYKQPRSLTLRYSLVRDGASMASLLAQCRSRTSRSGQQLTDWNIMVIEDSMGYVFGCYLSHGLENNSSYYGSGENFVFQLSPKPKVYRWTRENTYFFISDHRHLAVGGGGDGFAFQLDEDLDTGVSTCSATYKNEQLSSGEFFRVLNVEIWGLDNFLSI
eukprot:GSChrysophyteH1.ASY1.ANO1.218.1 assembled CDS